MNALISEEYNKLTQFQKIKFHELAGWQTVDNKGQSVMSDSSYFKILEWVKRIPEPELMVEEDKSEE